MIRKLSSDDAAAMADIHADSFFQSWDASSMEPHIQRDIVLGYGQPLKGFLIIQTARDQAELLTIAVSKSNRRSGIASKLLQQGETCAKAEGVDILFLEVAEDNPEAIAFYQKHEYEGFGRRPAYYKRLDGRVAALLFRKQL